MVACHLALLEIEKYGKTEQIKVFRLICRNAFLIAEKTRQYLKWRTALLPSVYMYGSVS